MQMEIKRQKKQITSLESEIQKQKETLDKESKMD